MQATVGRGWPVEVGGLGGTALDRGVFAETLTAAGFPLPFSFSKSEVLAPAVPHFAGPTLGREHFSRVDWMLSPRMIRMDPKRET